MEDEPAEKAACFETVLTLDPDNVEARLGLEMLQQASHRTWKPTRPEDDLEAVIAAASRRLEQAVGPPPPTRCPWTMASYCANHPNVETMLRCNRCGKPICTRCAVQTPVGYRCKQCVGQQQAVFYRRRLDYVIGGRIALVLGGIAGYLMTLLGAWFFALILGPTIGIGIAEVVRLAVRRRRSRYLWLAVGGGSSSARCPRSVALVRSGRCVEPSWPLVPAPLGLFGRQHGHRAAVASICEIANPTQHADYEDIRVTRTDHPRFCHH